MTAIDCLSKSSFKGFKFQARRMIANQWFVDGGSFASLDRLKDSNSFLLKCVKDLSRANAPDILSLIRLITALCQETRMGTENQTVSWPRNIKIILTFMIFMCTSWNYSWCPLSTLRHDVILCCAKTHQPSSMWVESGVKGLCLLCFTQLTCRKDSEKWKIKKI